MVNEPKLSAPPFLYPFFVHTTYSFEYPFPVRPLVFQHISGLLTAAVRFSILLIERAVVGLLRIALILAAKVFICIGISGAPRMIIEAAYSRVCVTNCISH